MKTLKFLLSILIIPYFGISQVDVTLKKTFTSIPPLLYGDFASFEIEVTNNSLIAVKDIEITDYVPCGLNFVGGNISWISSGSNRVGIISNTILPGNSFTATINFSLEPCTQPDAWTNTAQVTRFYDLADVDITNQDTNITNNTDNSLAPVFDLALKKKLLANPAYQYGDTLIFNIIVFNQGNQIVQEVLLNDYLPIDGGYIFDPTLNPQWSGAPPLMTRLVSGPILPGDSLTTEILLILDRTTGGIKKWVNYSEIAIAWDNIGNSIFDADSFAGSNSIQENSVLPGDPDDDNIDAKGSLFGEDEDDHDPAGLDIFDLALTKDQSSALSSFSYVQDVEFVFTIFNQGNVEVTNVEITDYLPPALNYINSAKNSLRGWVFDSVSKTAKAIYTKVLLPGQSDTLVLDLVPVQWYVNPDDAWDRLR
jgi:uncharacterized repeat protein (TIGR01451 family)